MGARISDETIKAMELVRKGKTPYEAAITMGISASTIYRSRLYIEFKKETESQPGSVPKV